MKKRLFPRNEGSSDDNEETIAKILNAFENEKKPNSKYYEDKVE